MLKQIYKKLCQVSFEKWCNNQCICLLFPRALHFVLWMYSFQVFLGPGFCLTMVLESHPEKLWNFRTQKWFYKPCIKGHTINFFSGKGFMEAVSLKKTCLIILPFTQLVQDQDFGRSDNGVTLLRSVYFVTFCWTYSGAKISPRVVSNSSLYPLLGQYWWASPVHSTIQKIVSNSSCDYTRVQVSCCCCCLFLLHIFFRSTGFERFTVLKSLLKVPLWPKNHILIFLWISKLLYIWVKIEL